MLPSVVFVLFWANDLRGGGVRPCARFRATAATLQEIQVQLYLVVKTARQTVILSVTLQADPVASQRKAQGPLHGFREGKQRLVSLRGTRCVKCVLFSVVRGSGVCWKRGGGPCRGNLGTRRRCIVILSYLEEEEELTS